ncbi:MAG: hypothetical protein ACO3M9_04965 [Flavobacteriaceae bacterium]|nr:hypothetical protein [Bacteroidota bacterium]
MKKTALLFVAALLGVLLFLMLAAVWEFFFGTHVDGFIPYLILLLAVVNVGLFLALRKNIY